MALESIAKAIVQQRLLSDSCGFAGPGLLPAGYLDKDRRIVSTERADLIAAEERLREYDEQVQRWGQAKAEHLLRRQRVHAPRD